MKKLDTAVTMNKIGKVLPNPNRVGRTILVSPPMRWLNAGTLDNTMVAIWRSRA